MSLFLSNDVMVMPDLCSRQTDINIFVIQI